MKNIIILGGSYAGITAAHGILKQVPKTEAFKIILVSPNTHVYGNMAAPRGLVPDEFEDDKLFRPILPGFAQYPSAQFEFILASAESLDVKAKRVGITRTSGSSTLTYDYLIIATGSRTKEITPLKGLGTTEETKAVLHDYQAQVKKAKTIVIAGAGVSGVETAGELGYKYGPSKEIILLSSTAKILPSSPEFVSRFAETNLPKLHVTIKHLTSVKSSIPAGPAGGYILTLSNNDILRTDMYIPSFGLTPNSSYIPLQYLNDGGFVMVDEYLRAKGAADVWAIGDVANIEALQYSACRAHAFYVAKSIALIFEGKSPAPYKSSRKPHGIQIGKELGTGHFGTWKMPGCMIRFARKTLFTENLPPLVDGSLSSWL